ncbi:hypothetical protein T459_15737 [Capsicum annuum]|uniref:Uncharacterized protein n=1 Tax=Capsicum annuum TaxID=4072 RepID=A0A2G2Z752_CAPAN|nr:hypothetical protein T459_15737 [Capsicum annuum]
MGRLKNEEDQNVVNVADHTEGLKFVLAFICTFVQLSYSDLEQFENTMSASRQVVENLLRQILNDVDNNVQCKYNIHHVLPSLMDNINDCISSCHRSKPSATITDEQLNFLLLNLHYISTILAEQVFPLVTQYEILQNVCGNMTDFHGLVVNGYVEQDIVKYVLPQFPLMAERVGLFLWDDRFKRDSRLFKLANLLLKIIPIELEGGEWNMGEEDTFENLKYLGLCEVTLAKWKVGEESFPTLEKLQMWGCRMLEEIPPSFGDICSLKIIQFAESPQLDDSTLKIKQYAEHMTGGDELKVEIF